MLQVVYSFPNFKENLIIFIDLKYQTSVTVGIPYEKPPWNSMELLEWLGYELWILRPWIGSQSCHIEFFFFSKFNTEIFSLKMEQWLKRLTLSWKFVDQKFQET